MSTVSDVFYKYVGFTFIARLYFISCEGEERNKKKEEENFDQNFETHSPSWPGVYLPIKGQ